VPLFWDQQFFDPIVVPNGKKLVTLRDAANYIMKLPKAEHDADEWQAAMETLLLVAESRRDAGIESPRRTCVQPVAKDTHWDVAIWRGVDD
jgi:hypothetical protein